MKEKLLFTVINSDIYHFNVNCSLSTHRHRSIFVIILFIIKSTISVFNGVYYKQVTTRLTTPQLSTAVLSFTIKKQNLSPRQICDRRHVFFVLRAGSSEPFMKNIVLRISSLEYVFSSACSYYFTQKVRAGSFTYLFVYQIFE